MKIYFVQPSEPKPRALKNGLEGCIATLPKIIEGWFYIQNTIFFRIVVFSMENKFRWLARAQHSKWSETVVSSISMKPRIISQKK